MLHHDGPFLFVVPIVMPWAYYLRFPIFIYTFYHSHMAPYAAATVTHIAISYQNVGNRWKPLETVVETVRKHMETVGNR